jgi:hypothetical protein
MEPLRDAMSTNSHSTNQTSSLVDQKRWDAKARATLGNHQLFYLWLYGPLTVVPGYMFIDLATGAGVDRAGHPVVLTIAGLLTLAGLLTIVLELRYLIKPATKELLDFVQCVNLVDKARQILESRTSKGLPVRGLDVCRILTAQLEENICQDQANNA